MPVMKATVLYQRYRANKGWDRRVLPCQHLALRRLLATVQQLPFGFPDADAEEIRVDETGLLLAGFPRSGNSFLRGNLLRANPGLSLKSHSHNVLELLYARWSCTPSLIPIRSESIAPVISLAVFHGLEANDKAVVAIAKCYRQWLALALRYYDSRTQCWLEFPLSESGYDQANLFLEKIGLEPIRGGGDYGSNDDLLLKNPRQRSYPDERRATLLETARRTYDRAMKDSVHDSLSRLHGEAILKCSSSVTLPEH